MVYAIAILMGYFYAVNHYEIGFMRANIGARLIYATPRLLLSLGDHLGSWLCLLSAYFVGSAYNNSVVDGLLFVLAAFGGAFASGLFRGWASRYRILIYRVISLNIGVLAVLLNIGLTFWVYSLTRD